MGKERFERSAEYDRLALYFYRIHQFRDNNNPHEYWGWGGWQWSRVMTIMATEIDPEHYDFWVNFNKELFFLVAEGVITTGDSMPILNGLVKKVFGEGGEAVEFGNDELKEWMVKFLEYQHFSFWLKRYGTEFMDLYDLGAQGRTEIKALIEEMAKVTGLPVKRIVSEFVELAGGMLADEADYNYIKGLG